jgi:predicted DNA binding CopG/RHH family protein
MNMKHKKIPSFTTEDQERAFWTKHSPLDYFDTSKARPARFPNLKPTLKSISIRLPLNVLENLKILANRQDVPYQSLAKIYLGRQIRLENNLSRFPKPRFSQHRRPASTRQVAK